MSEDMQCEDCNTILSKAAAEMYLNATHICPACGGALQPIGDEVKVDGADPEEVY